MEEMEVNHVDDIHEKLTDMVGDRVKVKANMGRTASSSAWAPSRASTRPSLSSRLHERRGPQVASVLPVYRCPHRAGRAVRPPESGEHIFTPLGNQLEEH